MIIVLPSTSFSGGDEHYSNNEANAKYKIEKYMKHADTFYWFGMKEEGESDSFKYGLKYLNEAEKLLKDDHEIKDKSKLTNKINALKQDLQMQLDMSKDTLYGNFPLLRVIKPSLFSDDKALGIFEIFDDPAEVSVRGGVHAFRSAIVDEMKNIVQKDIIIVSHPVRPDLENEVAYELNKSHKFFLHNRKEVVSVLSEKELASFDKLQITEDILSKLYHAFNINDLLIVNVNKLDEYHGEHFYLIEGYFYGKDYSLEKSMFNMGFSKDRNFVYLPLLAVHLIALLSIFIIFKLIKPKSMTANNKPLAVEYLWVVLAYFMGFMVPSLIVPFVDNIAPEPEAILQYSFWYPPVIIISVIFGPFLTYIVLSKRFHFLDVFEDIKHDRALFMLITCAGAISYLGQSFIIYIGYSGLVLYLLSFISLLPVAYTLGGFFNLNANISAAKVAFSSLIVLYAGFVLCKTDYIYYIPLLLLSLVFLLLSKITSNTKKTNKSVGESDLYKDNDVDIDIDNFSSSTLKELLIKHPFIVFDKDKDVLNDLAELDDLSKVKCLYGEPGIGKTTLMNNVIKDISDFYKENVIILRGNCDKPAGEPVGYYPFKQLLRDHFNINSFNPSSNIISKVDKAMDGVFDHVIPFSGLLFPNKEHEKYNQQSKSVMHHSILILLKKLSETKHVVILIDNLQWIDEESSSLLAYLIDNSNENTKFILSARTKECFSQYKPDQVLTLLPLDYQEKIKLLKDAFKISESVSSDIISRIGSHGLSNGELINLIETIRYLYNEGYLELSGTLYNWTDKYKKNIELPISGEVLSIISDFYEKHEEFRTIIECAACIGTDFNIELLANTLKIDPLALLVNLRKIQKLNKLITECDDRPSAYSFVSPYILDKIKEYAGITGGGINDVNASLIARELHYKIACELESYEDSGQNIYDLANHYFASGEKGLTKAIHFCYKAAFKSCDELYYDNAYRYLDKCVEISEYIGKDTSYCKEKMLISCYESNNTGVKIEEVAVNSYEFLLSTGVLDFEFYYESAITNYNAWVRNFENKYLNNIQIIISKMREIQKNNFELAEILHLEALILPNKDVDGKDKLFREAILLLEDTKDIQELSVLSKILNSAASNLSFGDSDQQLEAKELFHKSIEIKSKEELRDLPGLARSYGGLGRLELSLYNGDVSKAFEYFKEDLTLSEKIGDIVGIVKMNSMLGTCSLKMGKHENAYEYFRNSYENSDSIIDKIFAITGIVESSILGNNEIDETYYLALDELCSKEMPDFCMKRIAEISNLAISSGVCIDAKYVNIEKCVARLKT
jgi:tetratricopeptide (TPR) repeat protein